MLLFGLLPPPGHSLTAELNVPMASDDDDVAVYLTDDEDDENAVAVFGSPMSYSSGSDE
jgi:hypothetical protein